MDLKAGRPTGRTAERVEHLKAKLTQKEPEMRLNARMPNPTSATRPRSSQE
jgi:hypothetical protein